MSDRNRSGGGERGRCDPRRPSHPFPRRYRLTKTDEFSSVFGFRRAIKGRFFLLHWLERPESPPLSRAEAQSVSPPNSLPESQAGALSESAPEVSPTVVPGQEAGARLGVVIGKKQLRRAVGRNLVKRLARETFRLQRDTLPPVDLILRLGVSLDKGFSPTNPRPNRRELAAEMLGLLQRLRRKLGKAAASDAPRPSGDAA